MLADASPDEIWHWLTIGGKVLGIVVAIVGTAYKIVTWVTAHFVSKQTFDVLAGRVAALEASQRTVADEARDQKHRAAMDDLLGELVKATQRNHRK